MGYGTPRRPVGDPAQWLVRPYTERLADILATPGRPDHRGRLLRLAAPLVVYLGSAVLIVDATTNLGGLTRVGSWWSAPIAYQKLAVWTLLWLLLGLTGSTGLTGLRLRPPIGGALYWLQPETMRLPTAPDRVPFTAGTRRQALDVALYLVAVGATVVLLCSGSTHGVPYDTLPGWPIWVLLLALAALGLRDRTILLAVRPERFLPLLVAFLFPPGDLIFAAKLALVGAWWAGAVAGLHGRAVRAGRPWRYVLAVVSVVAPLVLLLTRGGAVTIAALAAVLAVEVLTVWLARRRSDLVLHAFTAYSALVLFGHYASTGALHSPLLGVLLAVLLVGAPLLTLVRPELVSFPPAAPTQSVWLFRDDGAEERFDSSLVKPTRAVTTQLSHGHGRDAAERALHRPLAEAAPAPAGVALTGLVPLAVGDSGHYAPRDGALVAAVALGWGEEYLPVEQLLAAIQFECDLMPGQLRVVSVRPRLGGALDYQLLDAADGLLERGTVPATALAGRRFDAPAPLPVRVAFQAGRPTPTPELTTADEPTTAESPVTPLPVAPRPRPGPGRRGPARIA